MSNFKVVLSDDAQGDGAAFDLLAKLDDMCVKLVFNNGNAPIEGCIRELRWGTQEVVVSSWDTDANDWTGTRIDVPISEIKKVVWL